MPTKKAIHHGKRVHIRCRRCGRRSYHIGKGRCGACGYGETKKIRRYALGRKDTPNRRKRIV